MDSFSKLLKKKVLDLISNKIFSYFIDAYHSIITNLNTVTILKGNKKEIKRKINLFIIHRVILKLAQERKGNSKNHYAKVTTEGTNGRVIRCDQAKV